MAASTTTIDQRYLRTAKGVSVPPHTETDRGVLAHLTPARGGNPYVHDHHLTTEENHIPLGTYDLELISRGWNVLLWLSVIGIVAMFAVMIARGH